MSERADGELGGSRENLTDSAPRASELPEISLCGANPAFARKWWTPRRLLLALSLFVFFQSMIISGMIPVVLSTLERRFGLTSKQSGFILSWYDGLLAVFVLVVSHVGHHAHRPRFIGRGMVLFGIGCLIFVTPYLFAGHYNPPGSSGSGDELACTAHSKDAGCQEKHSGYLALFALAIVFMAAGASPLYPLGSSMLDDNTDPKSAAVYLGIFYAVGALGPAVGFGLGGVFLGMFVEPDTHTNLKPESKAWVGAWWPGFLVSAIGCLTFCWLLFLIPAQLPSMTWAKEIRAKSADKHKSAREAKEGNFRSIMISLLTNPPYMFNQLYATSDTWVVTGVGAFLPKIVETQFRLPADVASLVSGGCIIGGVLTGMFFGSYVSRSWSTRKIGNWCFVWAVWTVCLTPLFLLKCDQDPLVGVDLPYINASGVSEFATCNDECHCLLSELDPVCAPNIQRTFLSPCLAGCTNTLPNNLGYTNCSCVPGSLDSGLVITRGMCGGACTSMYIFIGLLFSLMFLSFLPMVPTTTLTMRYVPDYQRSLALGTGSAILRFFGALPSPVVAGSLFDATCKVWETTCDGHRGACWQYDTVAVAKRLTAFVVAFKLLNVLLLFLMTRFYKPSSAEPEAVKGDTAVPVFQFSDDGVDAEDSPQFRGLGGSTSTA